MRNIFLSIGLVGSMMASAFSYDIITLDYQDKELSPLMKKNKHVLTVGIKGRNYEIVENELVIKFKKGVDKKASDDFISEIKSDIARLKGNMAQWRSMSTRNLLDQARSTGRRNKNVEKVDFNYIIHSQSALSTNDPLGNQQWYLRSINADQLTSLSQGSSTLKIGVADGAANLKHPDLINRRITAVDFSNADQSMASFCNHGTNMVSLIAAESNNTEGIAGLNQRSEIFNLIVLDETNQGTTAALANAITWAADNEIKLLNISAGTYAPERITYLEEAVNYALSKGCILIAAAGNDNINDVLYPAKYEGVIAVGGVDQNGAIASFSNYGASVTIYAPGENIISAGYENYSVSSGTSDAAAIVSGYVSLLLSIRPDWTKDSLTAIFNNASGFSCGTFMQSTDFGNSLVNNTVFSNLSVPRYADLAIVGFKRKNLTFVKNRTYSSTVLVKNMGKETIASSIIKGNIFDSENNSTELFSIPVASIAPGSLLELPITYTFSRSQIDSNGCKLTIESSFKDSDSTNNVLTTFLQFQKTADRRLEIFNIRIVPQGRNSIDTIAIDFDVSNVGNTALRGFKAVTSFSPTEPERTTAKLMTRIDSLYSTQQLLPGGMKHLSIKFPLNTTALDECTFWFKAQSSDAIVSKQKSISLSHKISATHGDLAHRYITEEAIKLLQSYGVYNVSEIMNGFKTLSMSEAKAIAGNPPGVLMYNQNLYFKEAIVLGNLCSDSKEDIVYPEGIVTYKRWDTHYWHADAGDDNTGGINVNVPSTYQKVKKLFNGFTWQGRVTSVISEYSYSKVQSYYLLGQALHLLQDMCVPAHTHSDSHSDLIGETADGDDSYEDYHKKGAVYNYSAAKIKAAGQNFINPYFQNADSPLRFMYYSANQIADYFASDDANGDANILRNSNPNHYENFIQPILTGFTGKNYPTVSSRLRGISYSQNTGCCSRKMWSNDEWIEQDNLLKIVYKSGDYDNNPPGDNDLKVISDELINYAIRFSAGLIYYFLVETNQQANLPDPSKYYAILSQANTNLGLDLDLTGGVKNGSNIHLWSYGGGTNQQWQFQYNTDGTCAIKSRYNPSLGLDANISSGLRNGSNIQIYSYGGAANQKWVLVKASGNYVKILSAADGTKGLDADATYGIRNGTNVHLWTWGGATNQNWQLVPVP